MRTSLLLPRTLAGGASLIRHLVRHCEAVRGAVVPPGPNHAPGPQPRRSGARRPNPVHLQVQAPKRIAAATAVSSAVDGF